MRLGYHGGVIHHLNAQVLFPGLSSALSVVAGVGICKSLLSCISLFDMFEAFFKCKIVTLNF